LIHALAAEHDSGARHRADRVAIAGGDVRPQRYSLALIRGVHGQASISPAASRRWRRVTENFGPNCAAAADSFAACRRRSKNARRRASVRSFRRRRRKPFHASLSDAGHSALPVDTQDRKRTPHLLSASDQRSAASDRNMVEMRPMAFALMRRKGAWRRGPLEPSVGGDLDLLKHIGCARDRNL
jgi:hypothetical protein